VLLLGEDSVVALEAVLFEVDLTLVGSDLNVELESRQSIASGNFTSAY
jgi:hypothetical protein